MLSSSIGDDFLSNQLGQHPHSLSSAENVFRAKQLVSGAMAIAMHAYNFGSSCFLCIVCMLGGHTCPSRDGMRLSSHCCSAQKERFIVGSSCLMLTLASSEAILALKVFLYFKKLFVKSSENTFQSMLRKNLWRQFLLSDVAVPATMHLQECPGARSGKCPMERFLSVFGHLAPSFPKTAF